MTECLEGYIYSLYAGPEIVNHGNLDKFKSTHDLLKSPKILVVWIFESYLNYFKSYLHFEYFESYLNTDDDARRRDAKCSLDECTVIEGPSCGVGWLF